ncbi:MAG: hypothetical protein AVDCRST_MAG76-407, partial [uncultured Acidimicrobiales bacterium]
ERARRAATRRGPSRHGEGRSGGRAGGCAAGRRLWLRRGAQCDLGVAAVPPPRGRRRRPLRDRHDAGGPLRRRDGGRSLEHLRARAVGDRRRAGPPGSHARHRRAAPRALDRGRAGGHRLCRGFRVRPSHGRGCCALCTRHGGAERAADVVGRAGGAVALRLGRRPRSRPPGRQRRRDHPAGARRCRPAAVAGAGSSCRHRRRGPDGAAGAERRFPGAPSGSGRLAAAAARRAAVRRRHRRRSALLPRVPHPRVAHHGRAPDGVLRRLVSHRRGARGRAPADGQCRATDLRSRRRRRRRATALRDPACPGHDRHLRGGGGPRCVCRRRRHHRDRRRKRLRPGGDGPADPVSGPARNIRQRRLGLRAPESRPPSSAALARERSARAQRGAHPRAGAALRGQGRGDSHGGRGARAGGRRVVAACSGHRAASGGGAADGSSVCPGRALHRAGPRRWRPAAPDGCRCRCALPAGHLGAGLAARKPHEGSARKL